MSASRTGVSRVCVLRCSKRMLFTVSIRPEGLAQPAGLRSRRRTPYGKRRSEAARRQDPRVRHRQEGFRLCYLRQKPEKPLRLDVAPQAVTGRGRLNVTSELSGRSQAKKPHL